MGTGFGVFGKLPALGDFLRLNLPPDFVAAWDGWLQGAMTGARAALGEGWDDCYLSAPIWRFTLPPGLAGAGGWSGILMPSVDRVGRRYPLTFAALSPGSAEAHFANAAAFARLEDIALTALEDETGRDALEAALSDVALEAPAASGLVSGGRYVGGLSPETALAARAVTEAHGRPALWTAVLDNGFRMLLTSGWPDAGEARGLFDLDAPVWRGDPAVRFA